MMNKLRILHLEDNPADAELVQSTLADAGIQCHIDRVASRPAFEAALRSGAYDVIVSDFSLPQFDGLSALSLVRELHPDTPFLFLSGTIGEERAVDSLKKGAADYILKDRLQRLGSAIVRAHNEAASRRETRKNEEHMRQQAELLNQAKDAIFVRNLNQEITYWNKAAERLYGWKAEEVVGQRADEILYKPGSPRRDDIWKIVLEKGEWTGEIAQVTRSGQQIFVSSHRTLLRDPNGNPLAVLNINTDITRKKELEDQVLRSQRVESIGALAGGIAHDLNNVLSPIMMVTELLRDRITDPEDLRMLDLAKNSTLRGADLVKQILQFARGAKSDQATVDLKKLLQEMALLMGNTFPRLITFKSNIGDNLLTVPGDATQIQQVILNLCVNARDAMPDGGVLTIRARNRILSDESLPGYDHPISGPFVELAISDTGTGIPPEILNRIFEPFFTTKPAGKGTGLGLATVQTIIRNHHGYLDIRSEIGKGTTFRIFLPAASTETAIFARAAQTDTPLGRGEWILLVDDERALLEMTKELLEAYNYKVLGAASGLEALQLFHENRDHIAAVITDLRMPGMGGDEVINKISAESPQTIAICMSGSAEGDFDSSKLPTCKAFLHKPCPTKELLTLLDRLLRPRANA